MILLCFIFQLSFGVVMRSKFSDLFLFAMFFFCLPLSSINVAAQELPDFTGLVDQYGPAVVNISTVQKTNNRRALQPGFPNEEIPEIFRHFFGDPGAVPRSERASLGSGFIISEDGYILTNNHVIQNAEEIIVSLSDRRQLEAELVGADKRSDLALLKIKATDLPLVKLGSSQNLKVGEWVFAIGSPFGFDHTVTAGIISAIDRSLPRENYVPFIQTDVAINPGNSGGPLFNMQGEVIGINSQIYSRTGGFMGLSFAIPVDVVVNVVEQLKSQGYVDRGWLGVVIQEIDRDLAESFGLDKPVGALVAEVLKGSPAEKANLKAGDVILEFNGHKIQEASDLPSRVGQTAIGKKVPVKIMRAKKAKTLSLTVGALPEDEAVAAKPSAGRASESNRIGVEVSNLSAAQGKQFDVEQGVIISQVFAGVGMEAGLRRGDIIIMINGMPVADTQAFDKIVTELPAGKTANLLVKRSGHSQFVTIRLKK